MQVRPSPRAPGAALALALCLAALAPAAPRAEVPVPELTGPVVDLAGLLGRGDVARLAGLCRAARSAHDGQGVQLQFLLLPGLEGEPIEQLSMRVAEAWKLGTRGQDNGVLVTIARNERAVRIEVGGGLEGGLTDVQSARIIREAVAPAFRQGRYGDGLYAAATQILGALGALPVGVEEVRPRPLLASSPRPALATFALIMLVALLLFLGGWRGGGGVGTRYRSSGGGWSSGGGGGGWSGGGGGFSGGGSSGSW